MVKQKNDTMKNEANDPLEAIINGDRLSTDVTTRRGKFTLAFPLPKDLRRIEVTVASRLEGQPSSTFSDDTIQKIRVYATLDAVIVDAPEWWDGLDSAEDCPDDDLIVELYRRYLRHYGQTQEALGRGGKLRGSVGKIESKDPAEAVDSGAFSGIADGQKV